MPETLLDKIWNPHRVKTSEDGLDLILIDRSLLTDLTGTVGLEDLDRDDRAVHSPALNLAVPDHMISTENSEQVVEPKFRHWVENLESLSEKAGIKHLPRGSGKQGIVHIIGLESGFCLPGSTIVCGDSHTSTHGAVGALAWGIGSTEVKHVLATQSLWMKKPKAARIWLDGTLQPHVTSKDLILWLIGQLGAAYGRGHAVEFAGPAINALSLEQRATLCNLAIEMSARWGLIAPDETVFTYLKDRELSPKGTLWDAAVEYWKTLQTDADASFEKEERFDVSDVQPQVTWGTSPEQVLPADGTVPSDSSVGHDVYDYIGLKPGDHLSDVQVDYVFIGSCANSRIEDFQAAAAVLKDRKIAEGVTAWAVPGSEAVRAEAEALGLDKVFLAAGFQWRQPGCSMCVSVNGDLVPPGKRCVSTSNRNFVGRQGPRARTHLASPATAAASAVAGFIRHAGNVTDVAKGAL